MGRKKKYDSGTKNVSFSIETEVHKEIEKKARLLGEATSTYVSNVLKRIALNSGAYAQMMMKFHQQEFYYWKNKKELVESQDNEKEELK